MNEPHGELTYRQRVNHANGLRFCVECYAELATVGPDADPEIAEAPPATEARERYMIRYSSLAELFCSGDCYQTYFVKHNSSAARSALLTLEGGICRQCHVDTKRLQDTLVRMPSVEARAGFFEPTGAANDVERAMFSRQSVK